MDNNHLFNQKSLKPLRSFLGNNSNSAESVLWDLPKSNNLDARKFRRQQSINHPGRESRIVIISKSAIPATPPLKGGETFASNNP